MIAKTDAIVLKSMRYRDTSRIVTFYTNRYGKISGIAKGVRDIRSRFGSSLQPMTHVSLVLYKKEQRDLHLVSQCDTLRPYSKIHGEIERMSVAMAMIELLSQVTYGEEENHALFSLLSDSLEALEHSSGNFRNVFYAFELRLASIFGFKPSFEKCLKCERQLSVGRASELYVFDVGRGAFYCEECASTDSGKRNLGRVRLKRGSIPSAIQTRKKGPVSVKPQLAMLLGRLYSDPLVSVTGLTYNQEARNELEKILRLYLESHFEDLRPLKTLKVFSQIL